MPRPEPPPLSSAAARLVVAGDLNELTLFVNGLVLEGEWDQLAALRESCRTAFERGKQLWPVASYIEYRLCLDGPGRWAAAMLEQGSSRFTLGPLPEVAASTHEWADLAPHLSRSPEAALAAHERALRGEDLRADRLARVLPEVLDLPLCLMPWEPAYALAKYHPDHMEAPSPRAAVPVVENARSDEEGRASASVPDRADEAVGAGGLALAGQAPEPLQVGRDEVTAALEELVTTWTGESDGRAEACAVKGTAPEAVRALGARPYRLDRLSGAEAIALMAWAGASGGAHGRRRGSAAGRFAAWWVAAAVGGALDDWPPAAARLGAAVEEARWYDWTPGQPDLGWSLYIAVEAGPGANDGKAWALAANDAP